MRPHHSSIRRMLHNALPFFLMGAAGVSACKKDDAPSKDKGAANAPGMQGAAPQSEAELDVVLAKIDGVQITVGEFQERINKQSPYIRARYTSTEQKKEFLDNLIRFEVLALQAKKEGFDKDPDVVRSMKQAMIQKLMKDQFENGIRPEDVTEEAMRAYYDQHPEEFNKPEEVRVSAIIVSRKAAAQKAAADALGDKGKSNKGFRELVALHSTDTESKTRGGDLRYFARDSTELPKELVEAAFALTKTGDVAGPIAASDKKFYIIKQTGHRKAIAKSFEDVKRQLQNRLYRDMRTQAQKDYIDTLKAKAKIEVFANKLDAVRIDTSTAAADGHGHGGANLPAMPGPEEEVDLGTADDAPEATH